VILKKLTLQKLKLLLELLTTPTLVEVTHPQASLPTMDVLPDPSKASEAFLPMSVHGNLLQKNYVPFVDVAGAVSPARFSASVYKTDADSKPWFLTSVGRTEVGFKQPVRH